MTHNEPTPLGVYRQIREAYLAGKTSGIAVDPPD